mmetsp:Transcript_27516/g.72517  ORF Transcript_27516/g.72517 Transcript_27516/m.72517 type:complete len:259 (+) Transcript_27516:711-1487(+)
MSHLCQFHSDGLHPLLRHLVDQGIVRCKTHVVFVGRHDHDLLVIRHLVQNVQPLPVLLLGTSSDQRLSCSALSLGNFNFPQSHFSSCLTGTQRALLLAVGLCLCLHLLRVCSTPCHHLTLQLQRFSFELRDLQLRLSLHVGDLRCPLGILQSDILVGGRALPSHLLRELGGLRDGLLLGGHPQIVALLPEFQPCLLVVQVELVRFLFVLYFNGTGVIQSLLLEVLRHVRRNRHVLDREVVNFHSVGLKRLVHPCHRIV